MRRVLILARGPDTAGTGFALKTAFDHCAAKGWEARMVRRKNTWLDYPGDIEWHKNDTTTWREVRRLWELADVVHVMQVPQMVRIFPDWERKPIVCQHIGTYFRDHAEGVSQNCRAYGALAVAGSHELQRLAPPGTPVLVGAVDLDRLAQLRRERYRPSDVIRIVHAPTNRAIKSTEAFLEATERLARRYSIEVDLIEGQKWVDCLDRKATADILFDQVTLGYGLNAIEAWGMGMPVVAGLADPEAREMFAREFGPFPFVEATPDTIEQPLERLIVSREEREHWGEFGRAFADRIHSERVVVEQAVAIYERAIAGKRAVAA